MKANRKLLTRDHANAAPVALLVIVAVVYIFEALLFATVLAEKRFPEFGTDSEDCGAITEDGLDGIGERIGCGFRNLGALASDVWAAVGWFVDLLTFNIPGAPPLVRFGLFSTICAALLWSIIALFWN